MRVMAHGRPAVCDSEAVNMSAVGYGLLPPWLSVCIDVLFACVSVFACESVGMWCSGGAAGTFSLVMHDMMRSIVSGWYVVRGAEVGWSLLQCGL